MDHHQPLWHPCGLGVLEGREGGEKSSREETQQKCNLCHHKLSPTPCPADVFNGIVIYLDLCENNTTHKIFEEKS